MEAGGDCQRSGEQIRCLEALAGARWWKNTCSVDSEIWLRDHFPFGSKSLHKNVSKGVCSQNQRELELLAMNCIFQSSSWE